MQDKHGEARKVPPVIIVAALALALAGLAYWGHRAAVNHTVETLYGLILPAAPARPESYPTEAARFERCQKILAVWRYLDAPVIDLADMHVALPLPLRLTRTTRVDNPEYLRRRAGEIFARDLAALSGRKAAAETPSAWEPEIEKWRVAIGHSLK